MIQSDKELEFAIFCIENVAIRLRLSAEKVHEALAFFYHSDIYHLVRNGISDMHCMSDAYLAEDLMEECQKKTRNFWFKNYPLRFPLTFSTTNLKTFVCGITVWLNGKSS